MISRIRWMGMALVVGVLGGCGGSDEPTFAAKGESCKAGTDCSDALYCLYTDGSASSGLCTALPAKCDAATAKCSSECGDLIDDDCGAAGAKVCLSVGNKITYTCDKPKNGTGKEGEACKEGTDCASGLLCQVKSSAGTCTKAPAECSGSPSCTGTCGDAISALCGGGSPFCSGSGVVTLICE